MFALQSTSCKVNLKEGAGWRWESKKEGQSMLWVSQYTTTCSSFPFRTPSFPSFPFAHLPILAEEAPFISRPSCLPTCCKMQTQLAQGAGVWLCHYQSSYSYLTLREGVMISPAGTYRTPRA